MVGGRDEVDESLVRSTVRSAKSMEIERWRQQVKNKNGWMSIVEKAVKHKNL